MESKIHLSRSAIKALQNDMEQAEGPLFQVSLPYVEYFPGNVIRLYYTARMILLGCRREIKALNYISGNILIIFVNSGDTKIILRTMNQG